MNEQSIWSMSGSEIYAMLHGTPYIWQVTMFLGFCYGLYRYGRSFKYLYYYYIEHGVVAWSIDGRHRTEEMQEVIKKHKLYEHFSPHGYGGGLGLIVLCTFIGYIVGMVYPISIAVGILTIPNFVLRWLAKEKRAKAVFQQNLQGKADGNA